MLKFTPKFIKVLKTKFDSIFSIIILDLISFISQIDIDPLFI